MSKKIIAVCAGVIILVGLGAALAMRKPATAPSTPSSASTNDATATMDMSGQQAQKAPVAANTVSIQNFAFLPASITIKKGTTVTWTNQDSSKHTVTPDDETAEFKSSELMAKDQTYQVTFNTAGTFTYHCTPHPNMKGTITVTD